MMHFLKRFKAKLSAALGYKMLLCEGIKGSVKLVEREAMNE
jgi:hypothetical protein